MSELSSGGKAGGGERTRSRRITRRPGRREQKAGTSIPSPEGGQSAGNARGHVNGHSVDSEMARTSAATGPSAAEPQNGRRRSNKTGFDGDSPWTGQYNAKSEAGSCEPARQKTGKGRKSGGVYAALDLGTNNCRLLIAVPRAHGRFRVIDGFSRIVRLGEGLAQSGRLSEAAMTRAVDALSVCAAKLGNRQIRQMRLIATEACRQADNGEDFLARVKKTTGLELEVVNRETEARLAAQGCGMLIDRKCDAAIMFDIGGGSTELAVIRGKKAGKRRIAERISAWTSLPLGVVTVAEQFGGKEVTPQSFEDMKQFVLEAIGDFADAYKVGKKSNFHLMGTSGTVTTLAGLHLGLKRYERRLVDGLWLNSDELTNVTDRLLAMDYQARRRNPCIGEERADLVLAGCAILEAIRETWPASRLRVADRGLREGLLTEMMEQDRVWKSRNKDFSRHNGRNTTARANPE